MTYFTLHQVEWFNKCFDFGRFENKDRKNQCRVTTDGTSCSLSYFQKGTKPIKKGKRSEDDIDYENRIDLSTVNRGLFTEKNCRMADISNIIGCDPGSHSLLTFGNGEKFLYYSKAQHYDKCFFRRGQQIRSNWDSKANKDIQEAISESSKQSFCIGNNLAESWRGRALLESILWNYYGTSRWRNLRFKQWSRKQSAYTDLVRKIKSTFGSNTVIAMGAAKFNVSMVGDVSGPLVEMARELSRHFRVVYTNEFRSSKGCFSCGLKTSDVKHTKEGRKGSIFCIRRCNQCRRYRNRDRNACLNIGEFAKLRLQNKSVRRNFIRRYDSIWPERRYELPLCGFSVHRSFPAK